MIEMTNRRSGQIAMAVLFICAGLTAQAHFRVDSVDSRAVRASRYFGIILPNDYDGLKRFPVLYLLHGHDGGYTDWVKRTDLEHYASDLPLIIVFPDADNSWYVNSSTDPSRRYEEYLVDELRHIVERRYRVDTTRRAIAGLSMGGYGALLYAFKYPSVFKFAGSLSGAFILPRAGEDTVRQPLGKNLRASLRSAFGSGPSLHRDANDVYLMFRSAAVDAGPYIYLTHGIQDGFRSFLPAHRALADSLRSAGVRYEYHERRGGHSWAFWGNELRPMLIRMRQIMNF